VRVFRHADPRFPFLWESQDQPAARWNAAADGPVQYLADTPDGTWAEFLRHEGITEADDLPGIERDVWAVELPVGEMPTEAPGLSHAVLTGGTDSYSACQTEARRLRDRGAVGLRAPTAALLSGDARGWRVQGGRLLPGPPRDGEVVVLFGTRPDLVGWRVCSHGRPDARVLPKVRHLPLA
jgi:hypothetical protein